MAKTSSPPRRTRSPDATTLLRADHKRVSELFAQFERARSTSTKWTLAEQICQELTIHATVEEEIFYPAVKSALKDDELVPEARIEHETLKALIAQIRQDDAESEEFEARVKVLSEYVKHHVKEEQNEMFPEAKKSSLDLRTLGEQIQQRKAQLLAEVAQKEAAA
jgi:hemerythrin superfamily protein